MLTGPVSKTFDDERYTKMFGGGFGNFENNIYVSPNSKMNEIGEEAFKAKMEEQVSSMISFIDGFKKFTTLSGITNVPRFI